MRENPPPFIKQMQQRVVDFFDLPEDKRVAALDEQIDEMEKMRKRFEKRRAERAGSGGGPGAGGRPPGGGPPGGNRGSMDEKQRNDMRKRMLDNSTPQQRAMFGEYFRQVEDRRRQRGLPPFPGPGR